MKDCDFQRKDPKLACHLLVPQEFWSIQGEGGASKVEAANANWEYSPVAQSVRMFRDALHTMSSELPFPMKIRESVLPSSLRPDVTKVENWKSSQIVTAFHADSIVTCSLLLNAQQNLSQSVVLATDKLPDPFASVLIDDLNKPYPRIFQITPAELGYDVSDIFETYTRAIRFALLKAG